MIWPSLLFERVSRLNGSLLMRKFLGTIALLAIIVAAVGFFRGWFVVDSESHETETNVEIRIDKEKIKNDARTAADRVGQYGHEGDKPLGSGE